MVRKRDNSKFNRDAFAPAKEVERIEQVDYVAIANNAVIKQHKTHSFLFGLMVGFILNTVLAITLISVQAEIDYKNSQAGIDQAVIEKIRQINTRLETLDEFRVPDSGEEAKAMNESSR